MTLRITNKLTTDTLIKQITDRRLALENTRQEIATGYKIVDASDSPGKNSTILDFQAGIDRIAAHQERISYITSTLEHQDSTLESANSILVRAKEIATQGANGSLSYEDRALLSNEVFALRDQLVSLANTTFQGRYIYGGADDDDPPFDATTYSNPSSSTSVAKARWVVDTDNGMNVTRSVNVTDQDSVRVNTAGGPLFSNAIGSLERLGRSLAGYRSTLDATTGLPDGGGTAYTQPADYAEQTGDILSAMQAMDSARINNIGVERSDVGARLNRLERVNNILSDLKVGTETSRASIQDADIFQSSAELANLQTALQALLASGSQINNLSLLNYL